MALTSEATRTDADAGLGPTIADLLGEDLPVRIECYDGTRVGAPRRVDAARRPLARCVALHRHRAGRARLRARVRRRRDRDRRRHLRGAVAARPVAERAPARAAVVGDGAPARPIRASSVRRCPPKRRACTAAGTPRERDAAAISYHYDVSNEFYRMVLGPSMTYSCAVWPSEDATLEEAQAAKYDLICRKLGLRPGHALARRRLRMGRHGHARGAPLRRAGDRHHAVEEPGRVRGRRPRPTPASRASSTACRTTATSTAASTRSARSACSSTSVWRASASTSRTCTTCSVRAGGCSTTGSAGRPGNRARFSRRGFIDRYVFPDGELHEVGSVVSRIQQSGLEVRHVESLREHYGLTLRALGAQPRSELGRSRRSGRRRHARASGGSTWPGPRSTSKPAATRSTRCSRSAPTAAAAASPGARTGSRERALGDAKPPEAPGRWYDPALASPADRRADRVRRYGQDCVTAASPGSIPAGAPRSSAWSRTCSDRAVEVAVDVVVGRVLLRPQPRER